MNFIINIVNMSKQKTHNKPFVITFNSYGLSRLNLKSAESGFTSKKSNLHSHYNSSAFYPNIKTLIVPNYSLILIN